MEFSKYGVFERKIAQLASLAYPEKTQLPLWSTWAGEYTDHGVYKKIDAEKRDIHVGDHWKCREHGTRWFSCDVPIPAKYKGLPLVLELEFGGEGLVRVDGEIRSAITSYLHPPAKAARTRVYLIDRAEAGRVFQVEVEAGINYMEYNRYRKLGVEEMEYQFRTAYLAIHDEEAEAAWFDLKTACDALLALGDPTKAVNAESMLLPRSVDELRDLSAKDTYLHDRLARELAASFALVDFDFDRQRVRASLLAAAADLRSRLAAIALPGHALIHFVGQAHIDTAWLWSVRETVRKTGRTFSNALSLMDRYPEFVFAFSQPQLFAFAKEHYPELYARIKDKVAEGQLELVGNAWVETDTNIPSGESLVRQLLYGRAFFLREFGRASDVFWMPDVFGYSWALPQIIRRSGMKYFFTSKLCNNDTNRFPHSLFQWQGIDGTQVTSYVQRLNYNGDFDPRTAELVYRRFDEKHISEDLMMTYGFGDGGGGPNYQMLETGRRLKAFPGLPRTKFSSAHAFFETADSLREKLPVWSNEMYYEFHRGTYSSQARTKKGNREGELALRNAEIASSAALLLDGAAYPYKELLKDYELLLLNQFHDILPGSAIHNVYETAEQQYDEIRAGAAGVARDGQWAWLRHVDHKPGDITVFNYLSWERRDMIRICMDKPLSAVKDREGHVIPCVPLEGNSAYTIHFQARLAPFSCTVFTPCEDATAAISPVHNPFSMENEFLRVTFGRDGVILSVYDKEVSRELLAGPSNLLRIFEDKPSVETAWNIDLEYQNKSWTMEPEGEPEWIADTDFMQMLRFRHRFHRSSLEQNVILAANSRRLDFVTLVDWDETEKMLKAEFNTNLRSSRATYEIQFGAIERSNHWNTSFDKARFEACGHKWADLSEGDYGAAILNNCKYGYDIKDGRMRITLLRSSMDPDPTADKGKHTFTYSLFPHLHSWQTGSVVQAGYELNVPPAAIVCKDSGSGASNGPLFTTDRGNVIIDTVKAAEDGRGIILRVYESAGTRTGCVLSRAMGQGDIWECNLMEEDERPVGKGGRWSFEIRAFEVKTFRLLP